jgi:murein DD-endopeptidase MepM/ murein hydrolase activator NlpD
MEKKIKFSDRSWVSKVIYGSVIAVLCVSAIIVGAIAAANRKPQIEDPPVDEVPGDAPGNTDNQGGNENEQPQPAPEKKLSFISPVSGTVVKSHSTTVPVFSETLEEWRIHTGIDVSCESGAEVVAAEAGVVSRIFSHPMLGKTVEITHSENHKSLYSNLAGDSVTLTVGAEVAAGDVIGRVGDTSVSELAEEPHLHFEMQVGGESVNPLDYISEESKEASLGIVAKGEAA